MEPHFPPNSREPRSRLSFANSPGMARVRKPLVEIPNGQFVSSKREDNGLESTISNFAGSSFAQIKPFGEGSNKENLGRRTNSNKFNGVFGSHPVDSGMWEIPTNKSFDQLEGAVNGDYGACNMHLEEQGGA